MIDPMQALNKATAATSSLLVLSSTPSVGPIPSFVPTPPHREEIGEVGSATLWVVFAVMLLSTLILVVLSWRVPVQKRIFHVITTLITAIATISYFAMAVGDGNSYVHTVLREGRKQVPIQDIFRQVFWARYIDWALTTPLLLLDLAFLAGLSGAGILVTIVADLSMVMLGLFAAFGSTGSQKWGYFAMAVVAYLIVIYQLVFPGRRAVLAKNHKTARLFASLVGFTLVLWTLYPIVWAIGDGAGNWSVDAEIIAYAVLDILAKPVFGFWLLFAHRNPEIVEGFWSHGLGAEGGVRLDED